MEFSQINNYYSIKLLDEALQKLKNDVERFGNCTEIEESIIAMEWDAYSQLLYGIYLNDWLNDEEYDEYFNAGYNVAHNI